MTFDFFWWFVQLTFTIQSSIRPWSLMCIYMQWIFWEIAHSMVKHGMGASIYAQCSNWLSYIEVKTTYSPSNPVIIFPSIHAQSSQNRHQWNHVTTVTLSPWCWLQRARNHLMVINLSINVSVSHCLCFIIGHISCLFAVPWRGLSRDVHPVFPAPWLADTSVHEWGGNFSKHGWAIPRNPFCISDQTSSPQVTSLCLLSQQSMLWVALRTAEMPHRAARVRPFYYCLQKDTLRVKHWSYWSLLNAWWTVTE